MTKMFKIFKFLMENESIKNLFVRDIICKIDFFQIENNAFYSIFSVTVCG